jgi:DNA-binding transcriptional MerR regulator
MRVGELARRTGVSVRTLHYYDERGLLSPSRRSDAGYRLYSGADVARLQAIRSLRQLGFSLEETRECLDQPDFSPRRLIELHLHRLRAHIALQQALCDRLERIAGSLRSAEEVSAEEFIRAIEEMTMTEDLAKYYTPEQMEYLRERGRTVGEERIREVEAEWPRLIEEVRAELERGTDPASERAQGLARRWMGLVQEFTGGDPGIERSLGKMWQTEESIHGMETAPMRELGDYISSALAAQEKSQ